MVAAAARWQRATAQYQLNRRQSGNDNPNGRIWCILQLHAFYIFCWIFQHCNYCRFMNLPLLFYLSWFVLKSLVFFCMCVCVHMTRKLERDGNVCVWEVFKWNLNLSLHSISFCFILGEIHFEICSVLLNSTQLNSRTFHTNCECVCLSVLYVCKHSRNFVFCFWVL